MISMYVMSRPPSRSDPLLCFHSRVSFPVAIIRGLQLIDSMDSFSALCSFAASSYFKSSWLIQAKRTIYQTPAPYPTNMKVPSSLLFIIGVIPSVLGSPSAHRPIFSVSPFGGIRDNRISALPDRDADGLRPPRGGSASPTEPVFIEDISGASSSPLFSVDSTTDVLVQIFGLVNAFHGVALGLLPGVGRSLLGSAMDEEDELAAYAEESVGCFALEYGITGYLAASGLTTPEMAIGYGTLFDLYFLSKNLVNGKFDSFGVKNLMYAMTIISAAGTYGILADKLHLGPVLEILTVIPAVQGMMKYFDPVSSGKKMLGADLSDNPVATALYRTSGQIKLVSAVLRGAIAFGVSPLRALSYSVFTSSALMMDSIFLRKTHEVVGKGNKALFHQLGSLALSLAMGTVFFLSEE